jgi:hypothetical protein
VQGHNACPQGTSFHTHPSTRSLRVSASAGCCRWCHDSVRPALALLQADVQRITVMCTVFRPNHGLQAKRTGAASLLAPDMAAVTFHRYSPPMHLCASQVMAGQLAFTCLTCVPGSSACGSPPDSTTFIVLVNHSVCCAFQPQLAVSLVAGGWACVK